MHRDEEDAIELAWERKRSCIPRGRQHVVGLVHNNPVRSARARPQLLEARQEAAEERWPALERDSEHVDDHALPGLLEHVKYFSDTGLALGIAQNDRVR